MGKTIKNAVDEALDNAGLSKKLKERLTPPRGKRWDVLSNSIQALVNLAAYHTRVSIENGSKPTSTLFINKLRELRNGEEAPDCLETELDISDSDLPVRKFPGALGKLQKAAEKVKKKKSRCKPSMKTRSQRRDPDSDQDGPSGFLPQQIAV